MATIFDGKAFAAEKEKNLEMRVLGLRARGVYPKLASIIVGEDPASKLYVSLKKKAAERIGAEVDIYYIKENSSLKDLLLLIDILNEDKSFKGIMVQMPIPGELGRHKTEILERISSEKDVDGLKEGSNFLHPTSKAVIEIINEAKNDKTLDGNTFKKVVVVGATGMVGKPLVEELKKESYEVVECFSETKDLKEKTLEADILVSVTGVNNLITGDMVKEGVVIIDVGSPKGDVDLEGVFKKVGFISPVPGGVGPITISCLLENLVNAC